MITIKYISWGLYDRFHSPHNGPSFSKDDIHSAIFDENARVKKCTDKKYIVLGRSIRRELLFIVVNISHKHTLQPVFVRLMTDFEKSHFYQWLPEHISALKGLDL